MYEDHHIDFIAFMLYLILDRFRTFVYGGTPALYA